MRKLANFMYEAEPKQPFMCKLGKFKRGRVGSRVGSRVVRRETDGRAERHPLDCIRKFFTKANFLLAMANLLFTAQDRSGSLLR